METKSRYEVLKELEDKKRELIKERDGLNDQLLAKQQEVEKWQRNRTDLDIIFAREIDNLKRKEKNLNREKEDFLNGWDRKLDDMGREKEDIERKREDNTGANDRKIIDVKREVENFMKTIEDRKNTIKELIKSVDESLQRFQVQSVQK